MTLLDPLLDNLVAERRNSLKTDRLDMSFGELINLYEDDELFISPEYQRTFRWSNFQQTRFIESLLLGIPVPPIFVAEDENSKWEVVDGLQRLSTILSFFGVLKNSREKNHLQLTEGEIIRELDGKSVKDLSIKLVNTIKRSVCRIEIVKWDSQSDIRYELFNRLNTGASPLSEQEIRNCIFRAYPVDLNKTLREIGSSDALKALVRPTQSKIDQMFLEELTLRFFAFKNLKPEDKINRPIPESLTLFMKDVSSGKNKIDINGDKSYLIDLVNLLNNAKLKNGYSGAELFRPNKQFAVHIFDSVAHSIPLKYPKIKGNESNIVNSIIRLIKDKNYREIGTSTYSNNRIIERLKRAREVV